MQRRSESGDLDGAEDRGVLLEEVDVLEEERDLVRRLDRLDTATNGSAPAPIDDGSTHLLLLRITSITLSITFIAPTIPSPSLALTNPILIIQQHATNPALPIPPRQCARTDSPLSV